MSFKRSLPRRGFLGLLGAAGAMRFDVRVAKRPSASNFLFEPGLAYLNTGALGPTPRPVLDRVHAAAGADR